LAELPRIIPGKELELRVKRVAVVDSGLEVQINSGLGKIPRSGATPNEGPIKRNAVIGIVEMSGSLIIATMIHGTSRDSFRDTLSSLTNISMPPFPWFVRRVSEMLRAAIGIFRISDVPFPIQQSYLSDSSTT
jgi:hypothetical protein